LEESGVQDAVVGREEINVGRHGDRTGIPVTKMLRNEVGCLFSKEEALHGRVIRGQDAAVVGVLEALRKASAGLANPNRPIGSFIFLGPAGEYRTRQGPGRIPLRRRERHDPARHAREHMERHATGRPVAPGYVGYEEGGQLTEA
jgi:ATP-dependent Clp protease ATP-binding subunit ClpA